MHNFDFVKPSSIAEAAKLLGQDGAQPLSGGQTLMPTMKQRLAAPSVLVSLTGIAELQGVCMGDGGLHIGGATAHAVVAREAAKHYPALAALAGGIGDPAVRSRGTIGGSIANNDPSACYPSAVLGGGATVVTNKRKIAADDFFLGLFETALEAGEVITSVRFKIPERACYMKFRHPASGYAVVGVMVAKYGAKARVAVTGAGPCVFRVAEMEAALEKSFAPASVADIKVSPEQLMGDIHCSAEYRAHLITVYARRAVEAMV